MRTLLRHAWKSVRAHSVRYVFVVAVLAVGFAFIMVATSVSLGMQRGVTDSALRHYAGHLFVMGRDKAAGSMMVVDDPDVVYKALEQSDVPVERIITRVHEFDGASVFFQGGAVRLKDLFGVDFDAERDLFQSFAYADGAYDEAWPEDTIVLSEPTAAQLRARVGDRIVVRLENRNRQIDTRTLVLRAIVADSSLYGYARAYMAKAELASLMALEPATVSVIGVLLSDRTQAEYWARRLHEHLAELLPVSGPIASRADLTREIRSSWRGVRYFVIPLPIYISGITSLLSAMEIGSYFLLILINLVVLLAVLVTYRVVLHDRMREIGTLLAVGFTREWILAVLLVEGLVLVGVGLGIGMLVSLTATSLISLASFDWIPGFEIFLTAGRLRAHYSAHLIARNTMIAVGAVVPPILAMALATITRTIPTLLKGQTV
ncbi:MAG: FtsX-like permease family protein [Spirochaetota bacterium]